MIPIITGAKLGGIAPFTSCRGQRSCTRASAQPQTRDVEGCLDRRVILGGLAALIALPVQKANAGFGWDGNSAALGSCAIGEDGAECRSAALLKDRKNQAAYPSTQEGRPQALTQGIPIPELNDAYSKETAILGNVVEKYFTLDSFDPQRPEVVKSIKNDGAAWASKYARGGSARKLSARKFYIVVDALQGHITSNGFAPLPAKKKDILLKNVEETRSLLEKGQ